MPLALNTNMNAMVARGHLAKSEVAQRESLIKLSSGKKINSSSDDASGVGISGKLHAQLNTQQRLRENLNNSLSFLQMQEGALQSAAKILTRMSELKIQSMGVTSNAFDYQAYNEEFMELQYEFREISGGKFNGISLFSKTSVKNHALQSVTQIQDGSSTRVSLARNFLSGEFVGSRGEVIGGREFELVTSATEPLPVGTASSSTGVAADGSKLPTGALDPNWSVTGPTSVERLAIADQPGPWADETATAGWLGNMAGGVGNYLYSMSFDLTDCDLSSVQIQGLAATDNAGSVFVNGQDLGLSFPDEFKSLQAFNLQTNLNGMLVDGANLIPNPLVNGTNNVTVQVNNSGGPTGLLFDRLEISASRFVTTEVVTDTITYAGLDQFTVEDFKTFEQNLSNALAQNGAETSRARDSILNLEMSGANLEKAHGRISDLDYALETAKLAKQQILSQASAVMVGNAVKNTDLAKKIIGLSS